MGMVNDLVMCATLFVMGFLSYDLFMGDMRFLKGLTGISVQHTTPDSSHSPSANPQLEKSKSEELGKMAAPLFETGKTYFFKAGGIIRNLTPAELQDPGFVKELLKKGKIVEGSKPESNKSFGLIPNASVEAIKDMQQKANDHHKSLQDLDD